MLRWLVKILLLPIHIALSLLIVFLSLVVGLGKIILYPLMGLCILFAIAAFYFGFPGPAIGALIVAFLIGPMGIPMVGSALLGILKGINRGIRKI